MRKNKNNKQPSNEHSLNHDKKENLKVSVKKVGRKPQYTEWLTEVGLALVKKWAEDGLIGKQIANKIGINHTTLYDWMNKFPEFAEAIRSGRKVMDEQVENSLLKRALGYQYEEDTWGMNHEGEMVIIKRVVKWQAPDVTAQIFWLKNRRPHEWRDKVDINNEHSGTIKIELGEQEKWSE